MNTTIHLIFALFVLSSSVSGQNESAYLKANAVRIDDPGYLSDSVYSLLSPYQIIMFGEMHGTNESAPFLTGLVNLFTSQGDSVSVGLEIPSSQMKEFISTYTEKSIYQSSFFHNFPPLSGKESFAWAGMISNLNKSPKVKLFFFDINPEDGPLHHRDSLMYLKIKAAFNQHPKWKMITLSGNYHNRISEDPTMTWFLKRDQELNLSSKICSLNMEYLEGSCMANFGHGLEYKQLGQAPRIYDTTFIHERYLFLVPSKSHYDYTGFYYTKYITAAKMTAKN